VAGIAAIDSETYVGEIMGERSAQICEGIFGATRGSVTPRGAARDYILQALQEQAGRFVADELCRQRSLARRRVVGGIGRASPRSPASRR
jgi:hypothetical protein